MAVLLSSREMLFSANHVQKKMQILVLQKLDLRCRKYEPYCVPANPVFATLNKNLRKSLTMKAVRSVVQRLSDGTGGCFLCSSQQAFLKIENDRTLNV